MPSSTPTRRSVLAGGLALAGLALTPELARAAVAEATGAGVFGFGVASGDPTATDVLLWTRVTPSADAVPGSGLGAATTVQWELAADEAFTGVLQRGTTTTSAAGDHTVKVVVGGLAPYTRYWYRFTALGATSPVGRTQTSPDEPGVAHALRLAFVSCSNWTGGYFTPYRAVAARDDLDLVLHLGDYVYEYGNGDDRYGPADLAGKRDHQPATEMLSLADYRVRHALYKTDPDLAAAHRRHPWVVIFDDHEVADNSYDGGAVNHQPDTEGDFYARRAAAYQAYLEWLPIRLPDQSVPHRGTRFFRRFTFGGLADLSVLETRQNRSRQVDGQAGALVATDSAALADPTRHLPEPEQLDWLAGGLAVRRSWHLLGNQVVLTPVDVTPGVPGVGGLLPAGAGGRAVFNSDQWDGYQADQARLMSLCAAAAGDVVVLTGDIHSSWANDVPTSPATYAADGNSVAVEFVCPSVTSDGFAEVTGSDQGGQALADGLRTANPHVRYLDGVYHGYCVLDVTPQRVQSDFYGVSSREDPAAVATLRTSWQSLAGSRRVTPAAAAVGARSDLPRAAAVPAVAPAVAPVAPAGPTAVAAGPSGPAGPSTRSPSPAARRTTRAAAPPRARTAPAQPARTLAFTGTDTTVPVAGGGLLALAVALLRRRVAHEGDRHGD